VLGRHRGEGDIEAAVERVGDVGFSGGPWTWPMWLG